MNIDSRPLFRALSKDYKVVLLLAILSYCWGCANDSCNQCYPTNEIADWLHRPIGTHNDARLASVEKLLSIRIPDSVTNVNGSEERLLARHVIVVFDVNKHELQKFVNQWNIPNYLQLPQSGFAQIDLESEDSQSVWLWGMYSAGQHYKWWDMTPESRYRVVKIDLFTVSLEPRRLVIAIKDIAPMECRIYMHYSEG